MKARLLTTASLCILLSACSNFSKKEGQFQLSQAQHSELQALGAQTTLSDAFHRLAEMEKNNFQFYAPQHLKRIKTLLHNSEESYKANQDAFTQTHSTPEKMEQAKALQQQFYTNMALIHDYEEAAYAIKTVIDREFVDILKAKQDLDDRNAIAAFDDEYEDLIDRMKDMIAEIEMNRQYYSFAKRPALIEDMRKLEAQVVVKENLKATYKLMDKVRSEDYDELAEATYSEAMKTIRQTKAFIANNYRDIEGVKQSAEEALFAAKHVWCVGKEVELLKEELGRRVDREQLEKHVLRQEKLMLRISEALQMGDIRDRSLVEQANAIAAKASAARNIASVEADVIIQEAIHETKERTRHSKKK